MYMVSDGKKNTKWPNTIWLGVNWACFEPVFSLIVPIFHIQRLIFELTVIFFKSDYRPLYSYLFLHICSCRAWSLKKLINGFLIKPFIKSNLLRKLTICAKRKKSFKWVGFGFHWSKMLLLQNLNMSAVRIFWDFLYTSYLHSSPLLKGENYPSSPK